jgi:hypothetical protein
MVTRLMPLAAVLVFCLGGCAATTQQATTGFKRPSGNYRLVVMKPDISVSVLTAGGMNEPREDWTNTARDNVLASLKQQQAKRGGTTQVVFASTSAANDNAEVAQLDRLHEAVGQSILLHKYTPYAALPTKQGKFDWTLGKLATDYGAATGNDYALFLYARDSFSSGGRVALQAMGMLGCVVGVCVMPGGGIQQAFVSLVDLKSGNVVWFNHLVSTVGDIRTPEGANAMVDKLLETMQDAKAPKSKKS